MGINPTPTNYKALSFDGVSSRSFGVYITGEGVFDAPKRSIEMVEIAGRNGAYAVDNGNFQNIEIKYPAAIVADTEADFADAIADFRSFLCSKYSYCRLEDEYNPDEYRMAIFKNGFEVSHDGLLTGEFELVFDCQPQRFLTSGETAVPITSGDSITNPTLFDARPMLEVYGYGDINIDGSIINIQDTTLGEIQLSEDFSSDTRQSVSVKLSLLNDGDVFTASGIYKLIKYKVSEYASYVMGSVRVTSTSNCTAYPTGTAGEVKIVVDDVTFEKGTTSSVVSTATYEVDVKKKSTQTITTTTVTTTITTRYNYHMPSVSSESLSSAAVPKTGRGTTTVIPAIYGYSTKQATGNPLYIDLDLGEAYNTDYGSTVSSNNAVSLPAVLPTLPSGDTEITYDNTITQLDIVPRWWRV